jgi:hypothetical protein
MVWEIQMQGSLWIKHRVHSLGGRFVQRHILPGLFKLCTLNNAGYRLIQNEISHVYIKGTGNIQSGIFCAQHSDGVSCLD